MLLLATSLFSCKDNSSKSSSSSDAIDLKMNFKEGGKFQYEMNTIQDVSQTVMGKAMNIHQEMLFDFLYEVKTNADKSTLLDVTYQRIRMKQESMGQTIDVDSDNPANANNETYKEMLQLKGKKFNITLNANGEVMAVAGMEGLGGNSMSDSSLKSMMEMNFKIYPDHPVKPGDTWKNNMQNDLAGMMKLLMANQYELVGVKNNIADVKTTSVISSEKGKDAPMEMEMSGTQSGTMQLDVETGMMLSSQMKQSIKGKAKAQGMEIPMEIVSTISITGKKL